MISASLIESSNAIHQRTELLNSILPFPVFIIFANSTPAGINDTWPLKLTSTVPLKGSMREKRINLQFQQLRELSVHSIEMKLPIKTILNILFVKSLRRYKYNNVVLPMKKNNTISSPELQELLIYSTPKPLADLQKRLRDETKFTSDRYHTKCQQHRSLDILR